MSRPWQVVFYGDVLLAVLVVWRGNLFNNHSADNFPGNLMFLLARLVLHHLEESLVQSHLLFVHLLLNDVSDQHKLEEVLLESLSVFKLTEASLNASSTLVFIELLLVQLHCVLHAFQSSLELKLGVDVTLAKDVAVTPLLVQHTIEGLNSHNTV